MVESVDDLESWQSIRGHRFPDFEMLEIAPSLKKDHPELQLQDNSQSGNAEGSTHVKNGRHIQGNTENHVPIVVPRLSTGSSSFDCKYISCIVDSRLNRRLFVKSSNNSTSKYQQSTTGKPVTIFYKSQKIKDTGIVHGDLLRDSLEWLEVFTETLEDQGVLASRDTPASTARESYPEPPSKVVLVKNTVSSPSAQKYYQL